MALCRAVNYYLKEGGATNNQIEEFLDFCSMFSKDEKTAWYKCYRPWARLLHHRRTPFKKTWSFRFRQMSGRIFENISVDAEPLYIPLRRNSTYFCLYLYTGLEFFNQILQLWSKFQQKYFEAPIIKIWNICTCTTLQLFVYTYCVQVSWHSAIENLHR